MDDPFNAILFAEDLITFLLENHGIKWRMPQNVGVRMFRNKIMNSRFNSVIGRCVLDIINYKSSTIKDCYETLMQKGVTDINTFRFECMISTVFAFSKGYDHEIFLNLCGMLGGLVILYFRDGKEDIACGATHVLAYVLNLFIYQLEFNIRNDWFKLALKAQTVRRMLKVRRVAEACRLGPKVTADFQGTDLLLRCENDCGKTSCKTCYPIQK